MMAHCKFLVGLTANFALALIAPAWADLPEYFGPDIVIEEPTATPASLGAKSDLRFRIVNDSHHNLTLFGLETPVASQARLIAETGSGDTVVLDSVNIPAGETLDLTTHHLRYEISPLRRPLATGDEFPATLSFTEFRVTLSVHVH